jgi:predicted metalloprotease
MKQRELADRAKNIPVNKSSIKAAAVDPNENNVKVCQIVKSA